ncbi:MAG: hypothetical protein ACTSUE_01635 [Promethearchaeota archaeon]
MFREDIDDVMVRFILFKLDHLSEFHTEYAHAEYWDEQEKIARFRHFLTFARWNVYDGGH